MPHDLNVVLDYRDILWPDFDHDLYMHSMSLILVQYILSLCHFKCGDVYNQFCGRVEYKQWTFD